jgi:hypothetical protein
MSQDSTKTATAATASPATDTAPQSSAEAADDGGSSRRFRESGLIARPVGPMGWGLFAEYGFAAGETIFSIDLQLAPEPNTPTDLRGKIIFAQEAFGPCDDRSMLFTSDFAFCCNIEHPFWFVNHRCQSNAGFMNWAQPVGPNQDQIPFVAYQTIAPGEQIFCEYSALTSAYEGTPAGGPWSMRCACGSANCRGLITGYHALPESLQLALMLPAEEPYGRVLAHVMDDELHLVAHMQANDPAQHQGLRQALRQQEVLNSWLHSIYGWLDETKKQA